MKNWPVILGVVVFAGCARFEPKPISAEKNAAQLQGRSLTNDAVKVFLENNLHHEITDWPHPHWDFDMLTLAAFYYHPDLDVARAQWRAGQAGTKTAGASPNPTLTVIPGYSMNPAAMVSPWFPAINLDVPIETAGKRGRRIAQAKHLSEAARLNLSTAAWQVRSRLRTSLLESAVARERDALLHSQQELQEEIVKLFEQRVQVGESGNSELSLMRIALQKGRLDAANAKRENAQARFGEAEAIGIPSQALDVVELSFEPLKNAELPTNLMSSTVRDVALRSRTDILSALAEYAAAEDGLRLEIAKQYPDVHLNPGYQFDQGEHKWSLGISVELPLLNRNQGPIVEARAHCEELAAKFNAVQIAALNQIERAGDAYRLEERNLASVTALETESEKQRQSVEAQFKAGAIERADYLNARLDEAATKLVVLEARLKFQQSIAALEDAVQQPLIGGIFSAETNPERENRP